MNAGIASAQEEAEMARSRRIQKWLLYSLGGVVALIVVARVGVGIYLGTAAGKSFVARKIEAQIGLPVEVTSVRLGLRTSDIALRVFDPTATETGKSEMFSVESARADVSLFGLLLGNVAPTRVDLKGANLTLHVNAAGDVITKLPRTTGSSDSSGGALPIIALTEGRITIRQEGRPEFALTGLNVTVGQEGNNVKITGNINDPNWAKWTVAGDIDRSAKSGTVELATADGPLTMDRLGSIPFVPASVWENVRPDGRGAAVVKLWTNPAGSVEYSVDITPASATLGLPEIDATLAKVTGTIRVSGAKVDLTGCKAELAGGTLALGGSFDFAPDPTVAKLSVHAGGLDVRRLPAKWGLPTYIEGKLTGDAELSLLIHSDGHVEPRGGGKANVEDAKIHGIKGELGLELRGDGKRYRFVPGGGLPPEKPKSGSLRFDVKAPVRCASPRQVKQEKQVTPEKKGDLKDEVGGDPTTLDASFKFSDIDINELLEKLEVKLGYKVSGKLSAELALAVPLTRPTNTTAYQFAGKVSSAALKFEGTTVRDLTATATYKDGKLTLTDLSGKIDQPANSKAAPGSFKGTATAQVQPAGDAVATLTFDNVPLGEVLKAVPGFVVDMGGTVSGKVELKAPYAKLWDTDGWNGSAELKSDELVIEGRVAKAVRFAASVAKGTLTLTDGKATLEGIPATAEGTIGLSGKYPFTATVRTSGTNVADLRKLVPEISVKAPIEGVLETETKANGTVAPFTLSANGIAKATKLTLGTTAANHIELKWALTDNMLTVSELKANVFGGSLSGSVEYPFDAAKRGKFEVAFKTLDAASATELVPDFPVRLTGKVSGKVSGAIEPAKPGQSRVGNLDLELSAPKLTVQGVPADSLVGKGTIRAGVFAFELEGKTLGGSFEVKGSYPGKKKEKEKAAPGERGSLKVTGIDLARLATALKYPSLAPLRGRVDATFEFESDLSAGSGRVSFTNVKWGDAQLSRELTGVLLLRDGLLELTDVSGTLAGGTVRGRIQANLNDTSRNSFFLSVSSADAKRMFAPLPELSGRLEGPVSIVVRGKLGKEMRGTGTLALPHGTVSGVAVSDLRIPFDWATVGGGYGRFNVREATVQTGSGRASATGSIEWGVEVRVDGVIQFTDLPLKTISPDLGESSFFGNGRITGRFGIEGRNVQSADDLTGTLIATLNGTSVKEIPLLRQAVPFLNPTGLVKPFESGDVRASLTRGVFRIDRLALANPAAQLFADGTITTAGRVDLNVIAHTGTIGPEGRGLRLFWLKLPVFGPIPLTLIRDVSDFLSNRTVRLTITGTTRDPVVRVNVGALLTQEAVRFLLTRYVVPAGLAGELGLSSAFDSMKKK